MWAIRILNGQMAGQSFELKEGRNSLGRGTTADIQINAPGVSKEHLEITMSEGKLKFSDMNSSNGTFLNGIRSKTGILNLGDKVGVHNIIFDVIVSTDKLNAIKEEKAKRAAITPARSSRVPMPTRPNMPVPVAPMGFNAPAYAQAPQMQANPVNQARSVPPIVLKPSFTERINSYIEDVVMTGFYAVSEKVELKIVMMGFVLIYVAMVTMLAIIPMKQITSESVINESKRRAITVARALALGNEKIIKSGEITKFSTEFALKEDGVEDVYVVSREGRILAPPERTGTAPKELSFIKNKVLSQKVPGEVRDEIGEKIGAAFPIIGYDTETQKNTAKAYAVVIYNPGNIMYDDGKVFGLFIQMLAIALAAGGALFFVLFKLVEYPFQQLNKELDKALRDEITSVDVKVQLPILHSLATNLNSLLSRITSAGSSTAGDMSPGARNYEYINIVNALADGAFLISNEGTVVKGNDAGVGFLGMRLNEIENRKYFEFSQQGFQKKVDELMQNAKTSASHFSSNSHEFDSGSSANVNCQALTLPNGEVDCYLFIISTGQGVASAA
jgi:PAS domain S-box-containing protein